MNTVKRSKLWFVDQKELESIVKQSKTLAEICRRFGYSDNGAQHKQVKKVLYLRKVDFSHIQIGKGANKGRSLPRPVKPLKEILVKNSRYDGRALKSRLIKESLLKEQCNKCGLGPHWQGEKLTLQLEHINGDHLDNRIENLEMLCPNCHTQTKTWGYKKR